MSVPVGKQYDLLWKLYRRPMPSKCLSFNQLVMIELDTLLTTSLINYGYVKGRRRILRWGFPFCFLRHEDVVFTITPEGRKFLRRTV